MLNIKESINLIGESKIKNETAVYMTATVTTDSSGTPTVVTNVLNEELYKGNRKECRADISSFTDNVYEIQDRIFGENTEETKEEAEVEAN
ncbi:hypothetical protein SAMN04487886_10257 [Clostridium sp. DSM 8431]|uniref:hypothetical protein n=1 Tax=Clostridium sp. DSM 8431 TaxID=1761781 RepID=UPI0008E7431C|nr:hypothetical protein [Clostridium sp. DSM 8431]SFU42683.1 hypothetical protein SAMN04487886_10257 [Clostridium sp. DSM 8431]